MSIMGNFTAEKVLDLTIFKLVSVIEKHHVLKKKKLFTSISPFKINLPENKSKLQSLFS